MIATKARPTERSEALSNPFRLPRGERLRRAMVDVFRAQRRAILHYLRTGRKDQQEPPFAWPPWHDFGLGALEVSQRMTPLLTATWDAAASKFAPRVGLDPNEWSVVNPHTERMIEESALAFVESTNATTSLQLDDALARTRSTLVEGVVKEGETLEQLTKRVNRIFDGAEKWRARRIAQTETSRAVHAAQEQAAIESGVVTGFQWLASADACPLCLKIVHSAPAVPLGHAFAVVGDDPHYSQVRFPPLHPYCNCSCVEVLDTDEQPAWHDTLHQPEPATEEEIDQIAPEMARRVNEIFEPKPARPKPKPAAKKPPIDPIPAMPIEKFAVKALEAARSVPVEERYGDLRVWIIDAFAEFQASHPGATMKQFKARLGEANNKLLITLSRCDLPGALSPRDRIKDEQSETTWLNATFHWIKLPRS